jgi:hypothetical protein
MNATSKVTREHHRSNREKLQQAHKLIEEIRDDEQIAIGAFTQLQSAATACEQASRFALCEAEHHEMKGYTMPLRLALHEALREALRRGRA